MSAYLDELYFTWLYGQVCSVRLKNPSRTYWNIFRILFTKEFVWIVPNDDNRVWDGKDLRLEFLQEGQNAALAEDTDWLEQGCCMLEMFIALARRAAFETSTDPSEWFWELFENLNLRDYNDRAAIPEAQVNDILDRVIWRTYRRNGHGGLFPLEKAGKDQRDVELWYQLCAYILERT